jgi:PAS domain S-box-containing protein
LGARETAAASALLVVFAIRGTVRGYGPFAVPSPNDALLLVQAFAGLTTTVMLSVAAEVAARRKGESQLRSVNATLERRVAERTEELVRANDRLVEAQQVAHVGSWEWDIPANRLWWSDELYRLYGVEPGTPLDYESFLGRVHPDDRPAVQAHVTRAFATGAPFTFDHRICATDGSVRVLHAEGRVVVDESGQPIRMIGTGHDITDRRRAEEERVQLIQAQAAQREAEATSRAKDEFLAVLSHELRTPVNAALGWAQMLRELPPDDPRAQRAVDAIYRNLLIQTRLVSDILDVSRIARGTLVLERHAVDVQAVVDGALEMVRNAAAARRMRIDVQWRNGAPAKVVGDAKRLQQVLWNLLSNAVRFGHEDGSVYLTIDSIEASLSITVADEGPGIPSEFLPHMFEPFRQADGSMTRAHDGLGLGLAIAKSIVELHGGTIEAQNRAGGGAAFTVRLPSRSESVRPEPGAGVVG